MHNYHHATSMLELCYIPVYSYSRCFEKSNHFLHVVGWHTKKNLWEWHALTLATARSAISRSTATAATMRSATILTGISVASSRLPQRIRASSTTRSCPRLPPRSCLCTASTALMWARTPACPATDEAVYSAAGRGSGPPSRRLLPQKEFASIIKSRTQIIIKVLFILDFRIDYMQWLLYLRLLVFLRFSFTVIEN